jgi:hypothetical protein
MLRLKQQKAKAAEEKAKEEAEAKVSHVVFFAKRISEI